MQIHSKQSRLHAAQRTGFIRRVIAVLSVFALSLGLGAVTATAAQAATPGIKVSVTANGADIVDGQVLRPGDNVSISVQYDAKEDISGTTVTINLPDNVDATTQDLDGNSAIESAVQDGNKLTVRFKDEIPADVTEGVFYYNFTANESHDGTDIPIEWEIGDEKSQVTVKVEKEEEPPVELEDGYAKSVNPGDLNEFVETSGRPDYKFLGLDPAIQEVVLTYTLVLTSDGERTNYPIKDTLPDGLAFVEGSFEATLTPVGKDAENYTFAPDVQGKTFSGEVDVPEQSTLLITYQVKVDDLEKLENLLTQEWEALGNTPGNYEIFLTNKAVFGPEGAQHERSTDVRLRGNIPGVGVGDNFKKTGNWSLKDVVTDDDGNLEPAAEMTYTLHADLTPWDERNENFKLQRNVVISDELIEQATWMTGEDFITVTGDGPITELSEATDFDGNVQEFAEDDFVGKYAIVDNLLLINVGKDNSTSIDIQVKAQLDTIDGLTGSDNTTVVDGTHYPWHNRASFHYLTEGDPAQRDHNAGVVDMPDNRDDGVNDSAAFNKEAEDAEVAVKPGETAEVPYRFEIDTSKPNIDPLTSRIVDQIDTDIFDVSDLDGIKVTGSYGDETLNREHFALNQDDKDNLIIELSEAGKRVIEAAGKGKKWVVNLVLVTIPFDGKETFEIYNHATLFSKDSDWDYVSDDNSEATSFGDEAEMRKRVFNPATGEWVAELDALIEDGEFIDDRFVYSIELIPRGNYGKSPVEIFSRQDVLPEVVEFLGFVDVNNENVPAEDYQPGPIDMKGNVDAFYDDGVVHIQQREGTKLNPNDGRIASYFAVEANDASGKIVNEIAGSETTITPVGDPSIDIEKWSDEGETPEYDESGALLNDGYEGDFDNTPGKQLDADTDQEINFTVSNDGREDLIDVKVSDTLTDGAAEIKDLVCVFPDETTGTEWDGPFEIGTQFECTGTLPALGAGKTHSDKASVTGVGVLSGVEVDDADEWHGFTEEIPVPGTDGGENGDNVKKGSLPSTGSALTPWLAAAAIALLLAGGVALAVRRNRLNDLN